MNKIENENGYSCNSKYDEMNKERMVSMLNHSTKIKEAHKERIQNGTSKLENLSCAP